MTLILDLDIDIMKMYLRIKNEVSRGQRFQKLRSTNKTVTQTDVTARITTPHSRAAKVYCQRKRFSREEKCWLFTVNDRWLWPFDRKQMAELLTLQLQTIISWCSKSIRSQIQSIYRFFTGFWTSRVASRLEYCVVPVAVSSLPTLDVGQRIVASGYSDGRLMFKSRPSTGNVARNKSENVADNTATTRRCGWSFFIREQTRAAVRFRQEDKWNPKLTIGAMDHPVNERRCIITLSKTTWRTVL